jgi:hypothetical protein
MSDLATPNNVAQAISLAIDEAQEGLVGEEGGLFLEDGPIRIIEVEAQLHHLLGGNVEFEVKTSDGRSFTVRVSES